MNKVKIESVRRLVEDVIVDLPDGVSPNDIKSVDVRYDEGILYLHDGTEVEFQLGEECCIDEKYPMTVDVINLENDTELNVKYLSQ